jgi:molecular chaperone HscB
MTYFELFNIPVQLKVSTAALSKTFFELSRRYHPDYFTNQPQAQQQEALEKSALLNKAWKTFQQPDELIKYVLQQKGLLQEEEKYELPAEFLMEVMDINEAIMDASGNMAQLHTQIDNLQKEIYAPVKTTLEHYQEGITTEKELLQVKEYYYKKKYLDRIRKELV